MSDDSLEYESAGGSVGKLPTLRRKLIYISAGIVWLTGAAWLVFHYFVRFEDQFGFSNPHPSEKIWLIIHAVVALVLVWQFGVLWPGHVKKAWKQNASRWSGGLLFATMVILAFTGVALYYIGSDAIRNVVSLIHWIIGLASVVALLIHLPGMIRSGSAWFSQHIALCARKVNRSTVPNE